MKNIFVYMCLLLFALAFIDCPGKSDYVMNPHPTPIVTDTDQCSVAESHLKELKCIPVDQPYTKKGKSFTQFCEETQQNGIFINPRCLSNVKTCDEIDSCTGTK